MSDIDHMPQRLIDSTQDAFLKSVLRSARADEPSPGARNALLASLGVAGAVGAATPLAANAVKWGSGALAKWFVLASVGAIAITSAVRIRSTSSSNVQSFEHVAPIARPSGFRASSADLTHVEPAPLVHDRVHDRAADQNATSNVTIAAPANRNAGQVSGEPRVVSPVSEEKTKDHAAAAPSDSAPVVDAKRLSEELKMLENARLASKRGDHVAAIAELDKHAQDGTAALKVEELVLRVQALAHSGDRAGANAAMRALEATGASSAHLSRARAAIAVMPKP